MHSDAKFVLVVEKEASFQRLMDDNVLQKLHPCIVITVSTCTNQYVFLTDALDRQSLTLYFPNFI